jgi:H+-transporting ATPase
LASLKSRSITTEGSILLAAVVGTQVVATLIAVYGLFMPPIGWGWALAVWGYALACFVVNDRIKLAAYRIIDPKGGILRKMLAD